MQQDNAFDASFRAFGSQMFQVDTIAPHVVRLSESGEEAFTEEHREPDSMSLADSFDVLWFETLNR